MSYASALGVSRTLLRLCRAVNLVMAIVLAVAVPASFLFEPTFFEFFSRRPPRLDPGWLVPVLRVWLLLALPMFGAIHILLSRLLAMVETVRSGDPFVPENAARLKTIAWCVLAIQLLHLSFGIMAAAMNAAGSSIEWKFSGMTGWVAVVLLFVLARVFEEGTRMREDLEAMV